MTAPVQSFPPTDLGNAPVAMALGFSFPIAGAGARVKSIQAFSITIGSSSTSNTATITSVDTTWSHIVFNGEEGGDATDIRIGLARLDLTNSTTVTATRAAQNGTRSLTVKGMVVEWEPDSVKSVQQLSITVSAGSSSNTATITSVDTTKSVIFHAGNTGGSSTEIRSAQASMGLTNATTVTASRANTTNALTVTGAVVEFK